MPLLGKIYLRGKVVCAGFEPLCVNLDEAPEGPVLRIFTFLDSLCIDPAYDLANTNCCGFDGCSSSKPSHAVQKHMINA